MRARERHTDYAAAHLQHMQKALTFMNIQLHHVIATITGVTGMRIIRAIVAGERDSDKLAAMRDLRCKESVEIQNLRYRRPNTAVSYRAIPAVTCVRPCTSLLAPI